MYGFDGNYSALNWALLCGIDAVTEKDKIKLIQQGYFLPTGEIMIDTLPTMRRAELQRRAEQAKEISI